MFQSQSFMAEIYAFQVKSALDFYGKHYGSEGKGEWPSYITRVIIF